MVPDARAWSDHAVSGYLALQDLPALRDAPEVEVESLEHFPEYPPRPDELRLGKRPDDTPRLAFLQALRLNPRIKLTLAIQPLPEQDQSQRSHLTVEQVMVEQTRSPGSTQRFIALVPGERVTLLAVLTSAADEPDWSLHYLQDLTQPYHATALPGVSLPEMQLMEGKKALVGYGAGKNAAIERIASRHMGVEKYQINWLQHLLQAGQSHPLPTVTPTLRRTLVTPIQQPTCATWLARNLLLKQPLSMRPPANGWIWAPTRSLAAISSWRRRFTKTSR